MKDKAHDITSDTGSYDRESDHSCNAASQAAWEQSVAADMLIVTST